LLIDIHYDTRFSVRPKLIRQRGKIPAKLAATACAVALPRQQGFDSHASVF
jgi:hypothetical protein